MVRKYWDIYDRIAQVCSQEKFNIKLDRQATVEDLNELPFEMKFYQWVH
jgi:hypothetical protein